MQIDEAVPQNRQAAVALKSYRKAHRNRPAKKRGSTNLSRTTSLKALRGSIVETALEVNSEPGDDQLESAFNNSSFCRHVRYEVYRAVDDICEALATVGPIRLKRMGSLVKMTINSDNGTLTRDVTYNLDEDHHFEIFGRRLFVKLHAKTTRLLEVFNIYFNVFLQTKIMTK